MQQKVGVKEPMLKGKEGLNKLKRSVPGEVPGNNQSAVNVAEGGIVLHSKAKKSVSPTNSEKMYAI